MEQSNADLYSCTGCHKKFYVDGFKTNRFGRRNKTCIQCAERRKKNVKKCEHNRDKNKCGDCGGNQICEHKKVRIKCSDCGGSQICEHKKQKNLCKDCGGSHTCEHNKFKFMCFICDPQSALFTRANSRIKDILTTEQRNGRTTAQLINCDKKIFFNHIEAQFKNGMSWDRIDDIHIDHIVPLKYKGADGGKPTLDEIIQRLDYRNCQPLWAHENIRKGNNLTVEC